MLYGRSIDMRAFKLFFVSLLVASVVVLGISQYQMFKELDKYRVVVYRTNSQSAQTEYMMEMFWELVPGEIEQQVKDTVREELDKRALEPDSP